MKKELSLVLETSENATIALERIKREGFNATVVTTESLRHAVEYNPSDHHFFNLRHFEKSDMLNSILCIFIVDADKLDYLKQIIRETTNSFHSVKGFMYSSSIDDYEGSF